MVSKEDGSRRLACPVCGYPDLLEPAWVDGVPSGEICVSCGTQFGLDDDPGRDLENRVTRQRQLRESWVSGGMRWWSKKPQPADWNPQTQLQFVSEVEADLHLLEEIADQLRQFHRSGERLQNHARRAALLVEGLGRNPLSICSLLLWWPPDASAEIVVELVAKATRVQPVVGQPILDVLRRVPKLEVEEAVVEVLSTVDKGDVSSLGRLDELVTSLGIERHFDELIARAGHDKTSVEGKALLDTSNLLQESSVTDQSEAKSYRYVYVVVATERATEIGLWPNVGVPLTFASKSAAEREAKRLSESHPYRYVAQISRLHENEPRD